MHYLLTGQDGPESASIRRDLIEAHKAYVASAAVRVLISGPILGEDEVTVTGSMFLIEADSKADVEAFNARDPFRLAGLWSTVVIEPFIKRVDNRG